MNVTLTLSGDQDVTLLGALIATKKRFLGQINDADLEDAARLQHEVENMEALISQVVQFIGKDSPQKKGGSHE
ncbi:hypothetical protein [Larkinella ripae]